VAGKPFVEVDKKEFNDALQTLSDMEEAIDDSWIKRTLRRKLGPMESEMKRKVLSNFGSERLASVIGITTAKKRIKSSVGAKVGVVKNDASLFPEISSFGLASILEYGTVERFRRIEKMGVITGRVSTGRVKPNPYLRPTYDKKLPDVIKEFEKSVERKVQKEAN